MQNKVLIIPKNILIIKLRKLGDVLATTPAVRQLRILYPDAKITVLTEPLGAKIYEHSSHIDELLILKYKPTISEFISIGWRVFRGKYDLVIDFYFHSKTALLTRISGARYRFGYSKSGKSTWAYNFVTQLTMHDITKVYCVNHQLKLIESLGVDYTDNTIEFEIADEIRLQAQQFANSNNFTSKTIAFCALSERADAQVPVDLLIKIGNYLLNQGYNLYFVYGPNEKHLALRVYNHLEDKSRCIIDYEVPTVAEQCAIFESCCLYVGNDGGNKHMATAAGISTIGIFYRDNPPVWTAEDTSKHRFLQSNNNSNAFEEFKEIFSNWSFEKREFSE